MQRISRKPIMRRLFFIFLMLSFSATFAQFNESDNAFRKAEQPHKEQQSLPPVEPGTEGSGGNPGDPVPIDQHLPVIFMLAIGGLLYFQYRKLKTSK